MEWATSLGCVKSGDTHPPLWTAGCLEAQRRFIPGRNREATDPDYKRGADAARAAFMVGYRERIGENSFKECANKEARAGLYYSDDATATEQIINQCSAQAANWIKHCLDEGRTAEKVDGHCPTCAANRAIQY